MQKMIKWGFIGLLVLLVAIQFVPVWAQQTNPPVVAEPQWDSSETRALVRRACFDCHSNETVWPIYSKIAPVSWLVTYDVMEGREELNFSEWGLGRNGRGEEGDELAEEVIEGAMPPRNYLLLHPEAQLSPAEQAQLIAGLQALGR